MLSPKYLTNLSSPHRLQSHLLGVSAYLLQGPLVHSQHHWHVVCNSSSSSSFRSNRPAFNSLNEPCSLLPQEFRTQCFFFPQCPSQVPSVELGMPPHLSSLSSGPPLARWCLSQTSHVPYVFLKENMFLNLMLFLPIVQPSPQSPSGGTSIGYRPCLFCPHCMSHEVISWKIVDHSKNTH